jgi:uncharacterized cupredoxin-like copper-binding protein
VAVAGLALASCGSKDKPKTRTTTLAPQIKVVSTEYAFTPKVLSAKAGDVAIQLKNKGKIKHELVIIKTSKSPGDLKVTKGRVSLKNSAGEIGATVAGATTTTSFKLAKGQYVFVCNIRGHYGDGMRGRLTIR